MKQKVYFKNLHSLRFLAALIVLLGHVEQLTDVLGATGKFSSPLYTPVNGEAGVILFFALSGFLITYLLLGEQRLTGTVGIKNFYIRRALRIWPLYFLTIVLAFFVYPFIPALHLEGYDRVLVWHQLPLKLIFYCIFMPNIVMDFLGLIPYASHTWTIGAEEQFYFIWPWLIKKLKNKIVVFISVVLLYVLIYYLFSYFQSHDKYSRAFFLVWGRYPISCMAIGAIYAWLVFVNNVNTIRIKKIVFAAWFQWLMLVVIICLLGTKYYFPYFNNEIYAFLLGYQVCNLSANTKTVFSLENRVMNYLGKISYGLYIYHPLAIVCAIRLCVKLQWSAVVVLYVLSLVIAVILSAVSYHFYERFFIRKKAAYSVLVTGDDAR
jgi:peptidoglycan/LPS O-acetylase OafA/YrhL